MRNDSTLEALQSPPALIGFSLVMVWSLIWKGFALYRAGSNRSPGWFVVLMFVNTLGILEILYLSIFSRRRKREMNERLNLPS